MVATQREALFEVTADVRVRYRRSEPPPPYTYAVTVEAEEGEGKWWAVRLWDDAGDVHEHHVHEYTREGEKQKPTIRISTRSTKRWPWLMPKPAGEQRRS